MMGMEIEENASHIELATVNFDQEFSYGNLPYSGGQEYLIATKNECLCIMAGEEPVVVKFL